MDGAGATPRIAHDGRQPTALMDFGPIGLERVRPNVVGKQPPGTNATFRRDSEAAPFAATLGAFKTLSANHA
jgi:hypothetical protein